MKPFLEIGDTEGLPNLTAFTSLRLCVAEPLLSLISLLPYLDCIAKRFSLESALLQMAKLW